MLVPWRLALGLLLLTMTAAASGQSARDGETAAAVQGLQNRILADPQLASRVHALSDDPRMREILADPEVAAALQRGDFSALLSDPRIRDLANDPAMQDLTRDVLPGD